MLPPRARLNSYSHCAPWTPVVHTHVPFACRLKLTTAATQSQISVRTNRSPPYCNCEHTHQVSEYPSVDSKSDASSHTSSTQSSTHGSRLCHKAHLTSRAHNSTPTGQLHAARHESVLAASVNSDSDAYCNRFRGHYRRRKRRVSSRRRPDILNGRWRLGARLGSGGFGTVYAARHVRTDEAVAVKISRKAGADVALETENAVYRAIGRLSAEDRAGIAGRHYFGRHGGNDVLVLEQLGYSLDSMMRKNGRGLCTKSVLMIGIQALRRLQIVHEAGFVHRDVKPDNLMTGMRDLGRVYLVDFGLAKRYRRGRRHVSFGVRKGEFVGTVQFASMRAHWGVELDRSDDLMSLGYSLVYLFYGKLPWQNIGRGGRVSAKQRSEMIGKMKNEISIEKMVGHMPREFGEYFKYVWQLRFGENPDYTYLRNLFREALERKGMREDRVFEWVGS